MARRVRIVALQLVESRASVGALHTGVSSPTRGVTTEARRHPSPRAERRERWITELLLRAGVVEITLGALHLALPSAVYHSKGFPSVQPDELSFVTLVILAVGLLLLAFGALTGYLASRAEANAELLFGYALIMALLWAGRVMLEVAYPVRASPGPRSRTGRTSRACRRRWRGTGSGPR